MQDVHGFVASGFEPLQEVLATADIGEGAAAFSAYVEGEKVVDLWAGRAHPDRDWQQDTLATAYSATKGMAAVVMMMLHDRGIIDVDAPVVTYWPEFGQAGKQDTLVRHLLNHTSGVVGLVDPGTFMDWTGRGWDDYDAIAQQLAAKEPAWEPGTRIAYHAVTYGWLCQEIVRRTTGSTLGEFFAKEVAEPLGLSIFIGTPEHQQARMATAIHRPLDVSTPEGEALRDMLKALVGDPNTPLGQSSIAMHGDSLFEHIGFVNTPQVRSTEIPGVNGTMDARSLARVYAALAMGGALDGVRLASEDTVRLFGAKSFVGTSAFFEDAQHLPPTTDTQLRYALGFEGDFGVGPTPYAFGPTPESFGHRGAGGQIGFADPQRRVSVGFLRTDGAEWQVSTTLVDALYAQL